MTTSVLTKPNRTMHKAMTWLRDGLALIVFAGAAHASLLGMVERVASDELRSAAVQRASRQQSLELYSMDQRPLDFTSCSDKFPAHQVVPYSLFGTSARLYGLCSDQFAVIYSSLTKGPLLVAERLNAAMLLTAHQQRTDLFFPDPRLPANAQADLDDYKDSGYDRGHNACAADSATPNAMAQSFSLSNIVPQDKVNNERVWNRVESATRQYVKRAQGDVFVFTGPLFKGQTRTIGRHDVWVPSHMYKLVYDQTTHRAWGWVMPNTADARMGPPMSYQDFVKETGLPLLVGQPVAEVASKKAKRPDWLAVL